MSYLNRGIIAGTVTGCIAGLIFYPTYIAAQKMGLIFYLFSLLIPICFILKYRHEDAIAGPLEQMLVTVFQGIGLIHFGILGMIISYAVYLIMFEFLFSYQDFTSFQLKSRGFVHRKAMIDHVFIVPLCEFIFSNITICSLLYLMFHVRLLDSGPEISKYVTFHPLLTFIFSFSMLGGLREGVEGAVTDILKQY
jgi:hypothetical protein